MPLGVNCAHQPRMSLFPEPIKVRAWDKPEHRLLLGPGLQAPRSRERVRRPSPGLKVYGPICPRDRGRRSELHHLQQRNVTLGEGFPMLGHIKPPCKMHTGRAVIPPCYPLGNGALSNEDLPRVAEGVIARPGTTPRASDSWPWVLGSDSEQGHRGCSVPRECYTREWTEQQELGHRSLSSAWHPMQTRLAPAGVLARHPGWSDQGVWRAGLSRALTEHPRCKGLRVHRESER